MPNPVLVHVTRGNRVESRHRGAVVVSDSKGSIPFSVGDIDQPVYPRSAVKAIQAMPLVISGAADSLGFDDRHLALACSSHSGDPQHAETAQSMLSLAGLQESDLECGGHWSFDPLVAAQQARLIEGKPGSIWNNCSGKHAGFLCTAASRKLPTAEYISPEHPVQIEVCQHLSALTGVRHDETNRGIDGCSIPTYAVPLRSLAMAFARMVSGEAMSSTDASAAQRLVQACMNQPFFVAGERRFCTRLMSAAPGRIFGKTGAEGVYCAAIPDLGLGVAVKADDGNARAAQAITAAVLSRLLPDDDDAQAAIQGLSDFELKNWRKHPIGRLSAVNL